MTDTPRVIVPYGPFVMLYSGRRYWLSMPHLSDPVTLLDVAVPLAKLQRFGGHAPGCYSVAEHSVAVSRLVRPELALAALFHDAGEAILGADLPTPVKRMCQHFAGMELAALAHVGRSIGVDPAAFDHDDIHAADRAMLIRERDVLFDADRITPGEWPEASADWLARARHIPLHGWGPTRACEAFLDRCVELGAGGLR